MLHVTTVNKYIRWHSHDEWMSLAGSIPEWPRVVGILDGTPFRISRPKGMKKECYFWTEIRNWYHC